MYFFYVCMLGFIILWLNTSWIIFPSTCTCSSGCGVIGSEQAVQATPNWWRVWLSWCEEEPAARHLCIPATRRSTVAPGLCVSASLVSHITIITSAVPVLPPVAPPPYSAPSAPHPPVMSTVLDACVATLLPASRGPRPCAVHILICRRAAVATRPGPKLAVGSPNAPASWADS